MPTVSNLTIKLQTGSDNLYFATWDFASTVKNTTTSSGIKVGDLVTIKAGSKWYNGTTPSSFVFDHKWYVTSIKGDRAVLGKNESGTNNIVSPINVSNLISASGSSSSSTTTESVSEDTIDHYEVEWVYGTDDGVAFVGTTEEVTTKVSTYSPPSNARTIKVRVKPVSKTRKVNDEDVAYWTGSWTLASLYLLDLAPEKLNAPSVEVEDYTLTASIDGIEDVRADEVIFQVYNATTGSLVKSGTSKVVLCAASFSCTLSAGIKYRVRCAAKNTTSASGGIGPWSDYSEEIFTVPSAPASITTCKATSETSIRVTWTAVDSAETYDIEYTTKQEYFDAADETTTLSGIENTYREITGLESGEEYFFRVRAVNERGESGWSGIKSVAIGDTPDAPTTWSSTTTAITGEPLNLYWVHNSTDNSKQTYAELEMYVDGVKETYTIQNENAEDDGEEEKTSVYPIDTSTYVEGTVIQWRVRTAGITKEYGDWSIQRTIDIYATPTLELKVTDSAGTAIETITSFPFYVSGLTGPKTQTPIGYHLTVTAGENYDTTDAVGNFKMVSAGESVYSRFFDTSDPLLVEISASNIDLENGVNYVVTCTASMNSGLSTSTSVPFNVSWTDIQYEPDVEIGIDSETYAAYIRPYCVDDEGNNIEDVLLSVYRRDFDGTFTEIGSKIDPTMNIFVTDPHPALDYARYRVVATSKTTGAISFYDVPPYPVGCVAAVLQWNDEWQNFSVNESDELVEQPWSGSMLKLPYNIDVSDNNKPDVSLVNYIGRSHPVSYYGTQIGSTSTWNMEIVKSDTETLYALRRLARWMGDVYVREPSGSGYWANITVSFSQKHCALTIPVTLNITRVEGGV